MTEDQKQNLLDIILLSESEKFDLMELIVEEKDIYFTHGYPTVFLLEEMEEDEEDYECLDFNLDEDWLRAAISYVKESEF